MLLPISICGAGWDLRAPIRGDKLLIHGAGPPICGVGVGLSPRHPWGWIPSVGGEPPKPHGQRSHRPRVSPHPHPVAPLPSSGPPTA